mmetsp:Transcript_763/g.1614  ORF Transcript_763/g.1614 Transcript_763/m.1614 type:complete len:202 (-) Transcript_763:712-1317(-)
MPFSRACRRPLRGPGNASDSRRLRHLPVLGATLQHGSQAGGRLAPGGVQVRSGAQPVPPPHVQLPGGSASGCKQVEWQAAARTRIRHARGGVCPHPNGGGDDGPTGALGGGAPEHCPGGHPVGKLRRRPDPRQIVRSACQHCGAEQCHRLLPGHVPADGRGASSRLCLRARERGRRHLPPQTRHMPDPARPPRPAVRGSRP